jgi:hypothetical protein
MSTRIIFANKETLTVSDTVEEVAQKLGAGGFAKLDRPWGDTSIYVNASEVAYVEAQDERDPPEIEALDASTPAPAPPPAGAPALPPLPGSGPAAA